MVLTVSLPDRLKHLIVEKQTADGYTVIELEAMPDPVHLLLDSDPRVGIHEIVGQIQGYPSHALRAEFPWLKKRLPWLWTRSKFISTVGAVTLERVQQYIENQKEV
jgi:putative transposase